MSRAAFLNQIKHQLQPDATPTEEHVELEDMSHMLTHENITFWLKSLDPGKREMAKIILDHGLWIDAPKDPEMIDVWALTEAELLELTETPAVEAAFVEFVADSTVTAATEVTREVIKAFRDKVDSDDTSKDGQ